MDMPGNDGKKQLSDNSNNEEAKDDTDDNNCKWDGHQVGQVTEQKEEELAYKQSEIGTKCKRDRSMGYRIEVLQKLFELGLFSWQYGLHCNIVFRPLFSALIL